MTKRSSSADLKRASSPLLSPVKEEFPPFQFPEGHSTPEFSDIQQSFITDLLEKQARQYERQNEDNNGYHERHTTTTKTPQNYTSTFLHQWLDAYSLYHWTHAYQHAAAIQIRTALKGRCTPYEEMTFGKRPNVSNLRIFGCEALAYVEKGKRTKLDNKVERAIYLGMSPDHSDDTVKLLSIKTMKIIYRRNVYYNERSFPARKQKLSTSLTQDTGEVSSAYSLRMKTSGGLSLPMVPTRVT